MQECRAGAAYTGGRPSGDERASPPSVGIGLTNRRANGSVPCLLFSFCRLILCLNQPCGYLLDFYSILHSMLPFYKNQKMERQCKTETAGRSNCVCICGWKNSNWVAVQCQVTCLSLRRRHLADILEGVPFPRA